MQTNKLLWGNFISVLLIVSSINTYSLQQKKDYNDVYPAWSPDGKKIIFQSDRDGDEEIYVMNIDGSKPKRLTDTKGRDTHPNWSNDGKKIVFQSNRTNQDSHVFEI